MKEVHRLELYNRWHYMSMLDRLVPLGLILRFYYLFLIVPYVILTLVAKDMHLKHHEKSISKHISDLAAAMIYVFVLFVLDAFAYIESSIKLEKQFFLGFLFGILTFSISSSYGRLKEFHMIFRTNNSNFGPAKVFWIIGIVIGICIISLETRSRSLVIGGLVPMMFFLINWIYCPKNKILHLHHWQLFFCICILIPFFSANFSDNATSFIYGGCYGAFLHGVTMFGFDPVIESSNK
jgi:hypothetical protein